MRRRELIKIIGGAVVAWPLAAGAQPGGDIRRVGVLGVDGSMWSPWTTAFAQRLRELGWIEGRTISIEYRWTEGRPDRVTDMAAEFVQQNVDIIVTNGTSVPAFKRATTAIPIVFAMADDPVGAGLVPNLSHPGGNVTGMSVQGTDLAGKRLQVLREAVPNLHRLAIMANANSPEAMLEMHAVEANASAVGIDVAPLEVHRSGDIVPAFDTLKPEANALYVVVEGLIGANYTRIITSALGARLPTIFNNRVYPRAGALMSYGPNFSDQFRRTAEMVDRILHGTMPGDIPVEQPTKFELVINLTTAKALGLTIPPNLLALADEVIE